MMEVTSTVINVSHPENQGIRTNNSSTYMNSMLLPEKVKASRKFPLGPDCQITKTEISDPEILKKFEYYWYISHEKGCVECQIKKCDLTNSVSTVFPQCVITRKCRRFEAYACSKCRSHFVTVVQALLHMKANHRPSSKILIQDLNVFHDIDKAMEIPPVPLPWYTLKKRNDEPIKLLEYIDNNNSNKDNDEQSTESSRQVTSSSFPENGATLSPALLSAASKALKRDKPSKTVRFTVGNPDSDDESGSEDRSDVEYIPKTKNDTGLKGVVEQLLSTASKVSIAPVDPSFSSVAITTSDRLLGNGVVVNTSPKPTTDTTTTSIIRVQSWAGPPSMAYGTASTSSSVSDNYLKHKSVTVLGRAYTYAEKIRMMKHMNDRDEAITKQHMKGKLSNSASTPSLSAVLRDSQEKRLRASKRTVQDIDHSVANDRTTKTVKEEDSPPEVLMTDVEEEISEEEATPFVEGVLQTSEDCQTTTVITESQDYYGQGEWAASARKTLQSSTVNSTGINDRDSTFTLTTSESGSVLPTVGTKPHVATRKRTISDSGNTTPTKLPKMKSPLDKNTLGFNKCASDPSLNKRMRTRSFSPPPNETTTNQPVKLAGKGDRLELLEEVYSNNSSNNVLARLHKAQSDKSTTDQASNSMNMNQLFENSVATFFKVKVVEKWSVCCVCGFKIQCPVVGAGSGDAEMDKAIHAHVMEHSFKDILKVGQK